MFTEIKAYFAEIDAEAKLKAQTLIIKTYHKILAEDAALVAKIEAELAAAVEYVESKV
jgi:hypothetical protein